MVSFEHHSPFSMSMGSHTEVCRVSHPALVSLNQINAGDMQGSAVNSFQFGECKAERTGPMGTF